jgi:Fe-S-cluster containining protein
MIVVPGDGTGISIDGDPVAAGVGVETTGVGEASCRLDEEMHPETASSEITINKITSDLAIFPFIGRIPVRRRVNICCWCFQICETGCKWQLVSCRRISNNYLSLFRELALMDYESFFRLRGATKFAKAGEMPCKGCGRCCREEPTIGLFPSDVYRFSKALGMTMTEFNDRYLNGIVSIGKVQDESGNKIIDSHAFGFRLDHGCPFQVDNKCSIHSFKPVICRAYPNMVMRTFRGDILKSFVRLHEDCSLCELADEVYILPDADTYIRLAFGVRVMQIYVERAGDKFDPRLVDNLYHKEAAWLKSLQMRAEAEADMDADVLRFVKSVEAAEANGNRDHLK